MNHPKQNNHSVRVEMKGTINAQIQEVFPLCCPVMEYKWIPGWKCEIIHFPNGHIEQGCIFNEIYSAPILADSVAQKTTWSTVLHDPNMYRVHFRLDNKISSSLYKIEFEADASGNTKYRLELTYSPINEKGIQNMENAGEVKIKIMLSVLSRNLKYFCEHGEMLNPAKIMKMGKSFKKISLKFKILMLLNKLMMLAMKDEDKKRYQKGLPIVKVKS